MTGLRSENDLLDLLCLSADPPVESSATPTRLSCLFGCSDLSEGLFESFEELVEIDLCRNRTMVPEKNKLLRCFQYRLSRRSLLVRLEYKSVDHIGESIDRTILVEFATSRHVILGDVEHDPLYHKGRSLNIDVPRESGLVRERYQFV